MFSKGVNLERQRPYAPQSPINELASSRNFVFRKNLYEIDHHDNSDDDYYFPEDFNVPHDDDGGANW